MANDHGGMVTINGIPTYLNIDEWGSESRTFKESSTEWLDYEINNNKNNTLQQYGWI